MGGSMTQSQAVYNYFVGHCFAHHSIHEHLPKEPTMHESVTDVGNYFKAVAASPKQIRGPHPDDLMIDEACEAKDEIIMSALPMVSSSPNPLVVMTSTFHKIFGYFQETWDNADALGYIRLSWDIFDVCAMFNPDIWDDPKYNAEIPDFQELKELAGGRVGDPEGWVRIDVIIQAWREKPTKDWFLVEYMGTRPSASGLVNKPEDVDACTITHEYQLENNLAYKKGATVVIGIDWGWSGMTSVVALMAHVDDVKVQLENENFSQIPAADIIAYIVSIVVKYEVRTIYADSSGKFENDALRTAINEALKDSRDHACVVEEVVFSVHKFGKPRTDADDGVMSMFGNYKAYFERRKLRILNTHKVAIWQHKRYHYQKKSDKPDKEDDHIPDATMLALKHWPLGKTVPSIPKGNSKNDQKIKVVTDRGTTRDFSTLTGGLMDERF